MIKSSANDTTDTNEVHEEKYLLFKLEDEEYGINISEVQSIEEMQSITKVPGMPPYVKGVIKLRQRIFPVIDLRCLLSKPEREYDNRTCIIITKVDEMEIGLIVDTVLEVAEITEDNINPAPKFNSESKKKDYIHGIGMIGESVKILIDPNKLFFAHEIETLQEHTTDNSINEEATDTQEVTNEI